MSTNSIIKFIAGAGLFIFGWLLQLLILNLGVYLFGYLLYRKTLDDATIDYLLRYIALPISTILPSFVIIFSARYLGRYLTKKAIHLQWLQPSVALTVIVYFAGSNANANLFQIILLAISGYVPLFFFYYNAKMQKKGETQSSSHALPLI